mgnify:CR=1 FL=1
MKKLITALALVAATSVALADSFTLEYTNADVIGKVDQKRYKIGYKHDLTKTLSADVSTVMSVNDGTNALGARQELGLTNKFGSFYTRAAIGQKFSNTTHTGYYLVEPGVQVPVDDYSFKFGYRYRTATDSAVLDQTRTTRLGVSYKLDKTNSISTGYDRMRGDSNQNSVSIAYTRNFN